MYVPFLFWELLTLVSPFASNARLLVAAEEGLRNRLGEAVDEDVTGLEALSNLLGVCNILTEDAGSQTRIGVVGAGNHILLIGPRLSGNNWTEWLLGDDSGVIRWVVDDGRLNEEALARGDIGLADCELVALLLRVLKEALHLLELHAVLDWAEEHAWFVAAANFDVLGEFDHALHEFVVDGLVNIHTLCGNANLVVCQQNYPKDRLAALTCLAGVEEAAHGDLGNGLVHIDIRIHDARVVAAHFQGNSLERLCTRFHDLLASGDGAGEGDLRNAWVSSEHRSEFVVTAKHLDNTGREDLLRELDELECGVRRERRWLHNDGTARNHCWCNLSNGKNHWEVPRANRADDAKRNVASGDNLFVVLKLLHREVETRVMCDEGLDSSNFIGGKGARLASLLAEQIGKFFLVVGIQIRELVQQLLALLDRSRRPRLEGLLSGDDCVFYILLSRNRNLYVKLGSD